MLCGTCEDLFSVWEGQFAKKIWYPLHDGDLGTQPFVYGDWLSQFAISVTWRSLYYLREQNAGREAPCGHSDLISATLQVWADFLNRKRDDVGVHHLHLLLLSPACDFPGVLDRGFLKTYIYRALDHTTIHSPDDAYILVKMGPVLIAGTIFTNNPSDWHGTAISICGGTYSPDDCQAPGCVWTLFVSAYEKLQRARAEMSGRQLDKIDAAFKRRFGNRI
jgi:hypothetical protein